METTSHGRSASSCSTEIPSWEARAAKWPEKLSFRLRSRLSTEELSVSFHTETPACAASAAVDAAAAASNGCLAACAALLMLAKWRPDQQEPQGRVVTIFACVRESRECEYVREREREREQASESETETELPER